jgi:hypothetical protein
MRVVVGFAAALMLAAPQPLAAQDRSPPRSRDIAPKSAESAIEKEGAAARARNEARERAWDDKMKRTMRSICSGVSGC